MGGDDGEDELCGDTSEDDLWVNPSTSDIIASIMNKSADEVMLMKPGSNKVHTFSLLDESQRNDIIVYVSNPEPGSKWCLWPRPGEGINDDRSDEGLASKAKTKQATANTAKRQILSQKLVEQRIVGSLLRRPDTRLSLRHPICSEMSVGLVKKANSTDHCDGSR